MPVAEVGSLSIVIVNYKTPKLCLDCMESLYQAGQGGAQILIIDNLSDDGSAEVLNRSIADNNRANARVICSKFNGGFSSGNNIAIKEATSDFILLLNSDTIVLPDAISVLAQTLNDNPSMGIATPRLEWPDTLPQESCFHFHRPISELIRSACTGPITSLLKSYEVPLAVTDEISYPEWTSFACVLIRREVFDQIGFLDEEFFMYFEDVDFCRRARAVGWGIINNPKARVVHLRGGSSPVKEQAAQNKQLPRYFYESRTRYYFKYYGRLGLLSANILWHVGWAVAVVRRLFNSRYQTNICERQWRDIWTNFLNPTAAYIHPDNYS